MRFGIGLWCLQGTASSPRHHVQAYRELLEDARLAEQTGFEALWLSEHHFFYDGYCPALLTAGAAVLSTTSRLRLGTGMLLLPYQDATRVDHRGHRARPLVRRAPRSGTRARVPRRRVRRQGRAPAHPGGPLGGRARPAGVGGP